MAPNAIVVEGLRKRFSAVTALDGIDLGDLAILVAAVPFAVRLYRRAV